MASSRQQQLPRSAVRVLSAWQFMVGTALVLVALLIGAVVHSGLTAAGDEHVLGEFLEHRSNGATTFLEMVTNTFSPLGTILISLALGAVFWVQSRNWTRFAYIIASVGGSALITITMKLLFQRQRPPLVDQLVNEVDFGFPSGHTTGIASLAFSVAVLASFIVTRRVGRIVIWAVAAVFIALVAGSRLYLGVHWFTDTIAGACVGVGTALALSVFMADAGPWPRFLRRRR